jgi:hypothetical protein
MGAAPGSAAAGLWPLLFGNLPMDAWPSADAEAPDEPPWSTFVSARAHWAAGDQDLAIRDWASLTIPDTWESRHYVQAWQFLRAANVNPDERIAHDVVGVVAEVAVEDGHDALAAYRVGGVRYLNHAGGASVVEDPVPAEVGQAQAAFLAAAQAVAAQIGPWTEPGLPELPVGHSRITMLTASGPHLGQGPDDVLRQDPMAGALFDTATQLLVAVVDLPRA